MSMRFPRNLVKYIQSNFVIFFAIKFNITLGQVVTE